MRNSRKGKKLAGFVGLAVLTVLALTAWLLRDRIRGWYRIRVEFERLPDNAQGYVEYRHKKTGIVFVGLPGGRFLMGNKKEERSDRDEGPGHQVVLSPFLIAKYELSEGEWPESDSRFRGDAFPITGVSWERCETFCRESGLKLPTEAQWEFACRAGSKGNYGSPGSLEDMGWYRADANARLHFVGQKKPNDFGLHDMHGNVWEWCRDVYDEDFYSRPKATERDPVCTSGSDSRVRVRRGGSWLSSADGCRSAFRAKGDPRRLDLVGFRPVWTFP